MGFPTITLLGDDYAWIATSEVRVSSFGRRGLEIVGPMEVVNQCDHCHRFDMRPAIAHSWEEAIERRWLVAKTDLELCGHEEYRKTCQFPRWMHEQMGEMAPHEFVPTGEFLQ